MPVTFVHEVIFALPFNAGGLDKMQRAGVAVNVVGISGTERQQLLNGTLDIATLKANHPDLATQIDAESLNYQRKICNDGSGLATHYIGHAYFTDNVYARLEAYIATNPTGVRWVHATWDAPSETFIIAGTNVAAFSGAIGQTMGHAIQRLRAAGWELV